MTNTLKFDTNTPDEVILKAIAVEAKKSKTIEYNGHSYLTELVTTENHMSEYIEIYKWDGIYSKAQEALARALYIAENGAIDEDASLYMGTIESLLKYLEDELEGKTPAERAEVISQGLDNPGEFGYDQDGYHWTSIDSLLNDLESEIYDYIVEDFLGDYEIVEFGDSKYLVAANQDYFLDPETPYITEGQKLINGILAFEDPEDLAHRDARYGSKYNNYEAQKLVNRLEELVETATEEDYEKAHAVIESLGSSPFDVRDQNPLADEWPALDDYDIWDVLEAFQDSVISYTRDNA